MHKGKKKYGKRILSVLLCAALLAGQPVLSGQAADPITVSGLLTDGVENPTAVDPGAPQFSWQSAGGKERGVLQTSYQIIVTNLRTNKQVWDSGKTESSQSSGVTYGGPELESDTPYTWKVKIWTSTGEESEYSEPATFRVGLGKEDWTASYIWEDGNNKENNFAYFRKNFEIKADREVAEAVVYTSAHNDYQLYLNGDSLGVGPARSDPYSYGQYCAYDITEQLEKGNNTFAALAHWHGVWGDSGVNAEPAYILEARVYYTDGTKDIIKTDDTWKVNPTTPYVEENPVYFGVYGGERNRASIRYDANREIQDWNQTDYSDEQWSNAAVVDRSGYNLYAQLASEQSENEVLTPVSVNRDENTGTWLVDFGKCITGWPKLRLKANEQNDEVKVQYWEVERNFGDAGYDTYIAKGGAETFYAPYVRHTSFRILEISGYKGELTKEDVQGIVAYSYADKQGSFVSSDERLNNVYTMSERSGRQNIQQGIISVDANREQSPWTADSWNIGIGYLYNHKNTMIIDKIIKDYAGEQLASGNFLTCSPARDYNSEMIEWSLYWPMLLWEQYLFSGSEELLKDYYPNLTKFLNYLGQFENGSTGLYNPSGWRNSDYAGGSIENGGDNIATNSQIYRVYEISAQIAEITGNKTDASGYASRAEKVKNAINQHLLVDGKAYKTTTASSQLHPLGTAWALRFGIVPSAFRDSVINWLAGQKNNYNVGGYGGDALYNGLYSAGLGEIATADFARYDQMWNTNQTNWESFGELSVDNMGNHAWTAYPSYILQKYVGGISPTSGGFATFDVKPVTGGLTSAEAVVPTVKGNVSSKWKVTGEMLTLEVSVPVNTTASIYVPDNGWNDVTVKEGDTSVYSETGDASSVSGLSEGKRTDGYIVFEAGSGFYSFTVTGVKPEPEKQTDFILDDTDAVYVGEWVYETASNQEDRYGAGFMYAPAATPANASATYQVTIEEDGTYSVYSMWGVHENRATNTPYNVMKNGESLEIVRVNQEQNGGKWNLIREVEAEAGDVISVQITNEADEYVIADAVRISAYANGEFPSEGGMTMFQQLQMMLYTVDLSKADNCMDPQVGQNLYDVYAAAKAMCEGPDPGDDAAQKMMDDLQAAVEAVEENQKNNLALNKVVTASDQEPESEHWSPSYITDGYKSTGNTAPVGYTSTGFAKKELDTPITVTIDLGEATAFNEIVLYPRKGAVCAGGGSPNFPENFEIQVSTDGQTYKTVKKIENQPNPDGESVSYRLDNDTTAQYVRLSVTTLGDGATDEGTELQGVYRLQFSEVEIFLNHTKIKEDGQITNITDISKEYDGQAVSAPEFDKTGSGEVTIEYRGRGDEDSSYSENAPSDAGEYKVRITVAEDDNYKEVTAEQEFTITPKELTVNVKVADKQYDGTDKATIESAVLDGVVEGDDVTLVNGEASFASSQAGESIAVNFTEFSLEGKDAGNYTLKQPTGVTADIVEKDEESGTGPDTGTDPDTGNESGSGNNAGAETGSGAGTDQEADVETGHNSQSTDKTPETGDESNLILWLFLPVACISCGIVVWNKRKCRE